MNPPFRTYPLPDLDCGPYSITQGPDGSMWFTQNKANKIGRISAHGRVTQYDIPTEHAGASVIVSAGGCLYFTQYQADRIGMIDLDGYIVEQSIPKGSGPFGIAIGKDQSVWFTCMNTNRVGRIANDRIDFITLPTPDSCPSFITCGADGAFWFTENRGNKIGRITPGGSIQEYNIPTPKASPAGIAAGKESVWFTEMSGNRIGRVDYGGNIHEYPLLPPNSKPHAPAVSPDDTVAFSLCGAYRVGCIPKQGGFFIIDLPSHKGGEPHGLTFSSQGDLWVALEAGMIGKFEFSRELTAAWAP